MKHYPLARVFEHKAFDNIMYNKLKNILYDLINSSLNIAVHVCVPGGPPSVLHFCLFTHW